MRVVSNTSPLSNLAVIGRLNLLREQFDTVKIPSVVASELARLPHTSGRESLVAAMRAGWLVETPLRADALEPQEVSHLDAGERAAITLALAEDADRLLIDEKEGRAAAAGLGIAVTGVIGVLMVAKQQGRLAALGDEICRLREEARFFVSASLERRVLEMVGER